MSDRLERARRWHAEQGTGAPALEDVEVAVRLEVGGADVVRRMLWRDADALLRSWVDLAAALDGVTATPTAAPAEEAPRGTPPANELPDPATLAPDVAARYEVLRDFVAERRAAGEDVEGVTDDKLREAAEAPGNIRRLGPFLRSNVGRINELLAAVKPPPAAPSTVPDPAPPPPQPRSTPDPTAAPTLSGSAEPTDFRKWEYGQVVEAVQPPQAVAFEVIEDGGLTITWPDPAPDGAVRVFRVTTNDQYLPVASPDLGDLLAATYDCTAADTRVVTAPVRHVVVWVHTGPTERAARDSLPTVYATGSCVMPVRNCVIREDEGTVIGQWHVPAGVERVDVLQIPADVAAVQQHYNPNYRLSSDIVGLGGFEDTTAAPGQGYVYRVYAFADVQGVSTPSPYVAREVRIKAVLQKIEDLTVALQEGFEDRYDLSWTTPPLGKVEIYRSESAPAGGIDAGVIDRGVLTRQGLTPDLLLTRQLDVAEGRETMRGVPWPQGWSRAYFTAVTVLAEDQIQVGNVVILNRTTAVEQVQLIERVDEQFLTFAWPVGAGQVRVYVGPKGTPLTSPETQHATAEIFEDMYVKQGGAHLAAPLPAEGCSVHVVAVSFAQGRADLSPPRTVEYPGLLRLRYEISEVEQGRGLMGGRGTPRQRVVVTAEGGAANNMTLVLVHQPTRLPLHNTDGQEFQRRTVTLAPGVPVPVFEDLDLAAWRGFVRLFAEVPEDMAHLVAVLDPAVSQLQLGSRPA